MEKFKKQLRIWATSLKNAVYRIEWLDAGVALGSRSRRAAHARRLNIVVSNARRALRSGWRQYGYYCALAGLLCLLGVASVQYRNQDAAGPASQLAQTTPRPLEEQLSEISVSSGKADIETEQKQKFLMPALGEVLAEFSPDTLVWSDTLNQWQTHGGVDIACQSGEAVYAVGDGTVTDIYRDPMFGGVIEIDHGSGITARYASLVNTQMVQVGERVKKGDVIASAGAAAACESALGCHVHMELYHDGAAVDFLEYVG